jgi:hypothetical protein
MKREIRFRAWDPAKKIMFSSQCTDLLVCFNGLIQGMSDQGFVIGIINVPPLHLMVSTGLIDMGGEEIYEGDILGDENGTTGAEWAPGMGAWGVKDSDGCMMLLADCDDTMQIVGNIYQNPELLEQKAETVRP